MEGYKDFTSLNNEISLVYPDFLKYKYEHNQCLLQLLAMACLGASAFNTITKNDVYCNERVKL